MITVSEFFSPNFLSLDTPQDLVSEAVNNILEEAEVNLAKGEIVFCASWSKIGAPSKLVELKNSAYLQLINDLVNDELHKFGWVAYVKFDGDYFQVKLAIKDSELESVKQQIK